MVTYILAEAQKTNGIDEYTRNLKILIFLGCFIVVCLVVFVIRLRR